MAQQHASDLSKGITRLLADSLDFIDDERVQQWLRAALSNRIEGFDLSGTVGAMLQALRNDNRHQAVLDDLLNRCAVWLSSEEAQAKLAVAIEEMAVKEYPLLMVFMPNKDQFAVGQGKDRQADQRLHSTREC